MAGENGKPGGKSNFNPRQMQQNHQPRHNGNHSSNNSNSNHHSPLQQQIGQKIQKWNSPSGSNSGGGLGNPISRNRHPDSKPTVTKIADPVHQTVGSPLPVRPGYVFVNGHWQRAKAGGATTPGTPIVRDHRQPQASGGNVTVTVTNPGAPTRDPEPITSDGPSLDDILDIFPSGGGFSAPQTPLVPRDHRDRGGRGNQGHRGPSGGG